MLVYEQPPVIQRPAEECRSAMQVNLDDPSGIVWIEFERMTKVSGNRRQYVTPPLQPGSPYKYWIAVQWGDRWVGKFVNFRGGESVSVDFRIADAKAEAAIEKDFQTSVKPKAGPTVTEERNFGVSRDRVCKDGECYRVNGTQVTADQGKAAVSAGSLTDDSGKWCLTCIGSEAQCNQIENDLRASPHLAEFKDKYRFQKYVPSEWEVANVGFVPSVYLQSNDGKVMHRQDSYDGPESLAKALRKAESLRIPNPNYNPSRDPDLRKQAPSPVTVPSWVSGIPTWVWLAAAVILVFMYKTKNAA